jgi:hypothetical protein
MSSYGTFRFKIGDVLKARRGYKYLNEKCIIKIVGMSDISVYGNGEDISIYIYRYVDQIGHIQYDARRYEEIEYAYKLTEEK